MAARIQYKASVARDLRTLDRTAALRVVRKIEAALSSQTNPGKALSGEFAGLWRLRAGDYRMVYVPTEEGFLILRIAHRKDVYKKGRPVK